jgi:ABC-type phosphate/phosphonate transport system substrate-binding protein
MRYLLGLLMFVLAATPLLAKEKGLDLLIQPALSQENTQQYYDSLAAYLGKATGMKVRIVVADNYLAHWNAVRKGSGYDLVLDAAHFTDYRIKNFNYEVLAKAPAAVSFSFITRHDTPFPGKDGLLSKTIATTPSPSLGGVQLLHMYPNPARQPRIIEVKNYAEAIAKVKSGKAFTALVPASMIKGDRNLKSTEVTQSVPQIALSASPGLSTSIKDRIRAALLDAGSTREGQRMLAKIHLTDFEPATSSTYAGYASLLKGVWGY